MTNFRNHGIPTAQEIARITAEAHAIRARAVREAVVGFFQKIGTVFGAIGEARRNARAYAELQAMDDRLLKDIGVNRSEIPAIILGEKAGRGELVANENKVPAGAVPRPAA